MYISVKYLRDDLGVDEEIARFFVDRKVPENNAFWLKKLLYIGRGNGYISIPVYYDLLYRMGISKTVLLAEAHILLMEQIMHQALRVEMNQISFSDQVQQIELLFSQGLVNQDFYTELLAYLNQPVLRPRGDLGMEVLALNRADVFLFILCDLPLSPNQTSLAVSYWYALHTTYLLMDDIYDYHGDKQNGEENAVLEMGDGPAGTAKAFDILNNNVSVLKAVNPVLSQFFEHALIDLRQSIQ